MKNIKPLTTRSYRCIFIGRFLYAEPSEMHSERWEFKSLVDNGDLGCNILWDETLNRDFQHTIVYHEYLSIMADTIFVPCPAGNNPETFRHYEALELGSIPLIVRPNKRSTNIQ